MIITTSRDQISGLSLIWAGDMFASLTVYVSLLRRQQQQQHPKRPLATGNLGDRRTTTTISRRQSLNLVVVIFFICRASKRFIGVRVVKPRSMQAQHGGCELARASL
jgi:hypothetical protein